MAAPDPLDLLIHNLDSTSHLQARLPKVDQDSRGGKLPRTTHQLASLENEVGKPFHT
jgi:hypothetical protein